MKKIIDLINPKKLSMSIQLFLLIFSIFIIFIIIEILLISNIREKALLSEETISISETFLNENNFTDEKVSPFMRENNLYVISTDSNLNIIENTYTTLSLENNAVKFFYENIENYSISNTLKPFDIDGKTIYISKHDSLNESIYIIIPTALNSSFTSSLYLYQSLTIISILIILAILMIIINTLYVNPIKDMTIITSRMKNLNFAYGTEKYNNKDYDALGKEINAVSNSLEEVINNLNYKNETITKYIQTQEKEYDFKNQLVSTISHEIKTPLAVMQATISAIIDGIIAPNDYNKELNLLLNEIDKTNNMLKEIVEIYKIETSSYELNLTKVDLNKLILNSISNLSKIADKYSQKILYTKTDNILVEIDEKQMIRVINNIILNAITYSPKGNNIAISLQDKTKYYLLEVINYGINIKNADLEKVFEPFYRADKSRQKKEDHGNGLGLYFVKEVLKKHNFDFGIQNIINGVKFYIIINKSKIE